MKGVHDEIRRQGPRPGGEGDPPHRVGAQQHAGAPHDRGAIHPRTTVQGASGLGLSPRDVRNGQSDAGAQGRRGGGLPLRQQPAQHAGRRGGLAGPGIRNRGVRHPGRGQGDLLPAHQRRPGFQAAPDHGRRRGHHRGHPQPAQGSRRERDRRHRGNHHRRHPPQEHGAGRRPALPHHRGQRRGHQAFLRQPLRHGPEHAGRHPAGHQPPPGRQALRGLRIRLVRTRCGEPGAGDGGQCHRGRDRIPCGRWRP